MRKSKVNRRGEIASPKPYDLCGTPGYALDPILPYLPASWTIWECACGEGLMTRALERAGKRVVSSDIQTGQNFLEYEPPFYSAIVTNPPFSVKYDFIERAYKLGKPFALLVPVETIASVKVQTLAALHGFEWIFMHPRVDFKMPNKGWDGKGSHFPVMWITNRLNIGSPVTFARVVKTPRVELEFVNA